MIKKLCFYTAEDGDLMGCLDVVAVPAGGGVTRCLVTAPQALLPRPAYVVAVDEHGNTAGQGDIVGTLDDVIDDRIAATLEAIVAGLNDA